jgi:hypothetical protein
VALDIFNSAKPDKFAFAKISLAEEVVPGVAQFEVPKSNLIKEFKSASLKSPFPELPFSSCKKVKLPKLISNGFQISKSFLCVTFPSSSS